MAAYQVPLGSPVKCVKIPVCGLGFSDLYHSVCGLLPPLFCFPYSFPLACPTCLPHTCHLCFYNNSLSLLSAPTISGNSSSVPTKVLKSVSFINFFWGFWTFTFVISTDLTFQLLAACFFSVERVDICGCLMGTANGKS